MDLDLARIEFFVFFAFIFNNTTCKSKEFCRNMQILLIQNANNVRFLEIIV